MDEYVKSLLMERRSELIVRLQRSQHEVRHHHDSMLAAQRDVEDTQKKVSAVEASLFAEVIDL